MATWLGKPSSLFQRQGGNGNRSSIALAIPPESCEGSVSPAGGSVHRVIDENRPTELDATHGGTAVLAEFTFSGGRTQGDFAGNRT